MHTGTNTQVNDLDSRPGTLAIGSPRREWPFWRNDQLFSGQPETGLISAYIAPRLADLPLRDYGSQALLFLFTGVSKVQWRVDPECTLITRSGITHHPSVTVLGKERIA